MKRFRNAFDKTFLPPYVAPGGFCVANSMKCGCGVIVSCSSGTNSSRLSSRRRFRASRTSEGARLSSSRTIQYPRLTACTSAPSWNASCPASWGGVGWGGVVRRDGDDDALVVSARVGVVLADGSVGRSVEAAEAEADGKKSNRIEKPTDASNVPSGSSARRRDAGTCGHNQRVCSAASFQLGIAHGVRAYE